MTRYEVRKWRHGVSVNEAYYDGAEHYASEEAWTTRMAECYAQGFEITYQEGIWTIFEKDDGSFRYVVSFHIQNT